MFHSEYGKPGKFPMNCPENISILYLIEYFFLSVNIDITKLDAFIFLLLL